MTDFDAWAKSSAEAGGLFRAWRRRRSERAAEVAQQGISRRDLMKKAGVVGAATIWTTPLVQTVAAPAFANHSGTCTENHCGATNSCPACINGKQCASVDANCASGYCSSSGMCTAPPTAVAAGGSCHATTQTAADAQCSSGYCNGNSTNSTCAPPPTGIMNGNACHGSTQNVANSQCSSGTCSSTNGVCRTTGTGIIGNGSTCSGTDQATRDASCGSGYCNGNQSTSVCAPPPTSTVNGGTCHAATQTLASGQCSSGTCSSTNGVCQTAGTGTIANGSTCRTTGNQRDKDASCGSGYCDSSTTCQASPTGVSSGSVCHGATTAVASSQCTKLRCQKSASNTSETESGVCA